MHRDRRHNQFRHVRCRVLAVTQQDSWLGRCRRFQRGSRASRTNHSARALPCRGSGRLAFGPPLVRGEEGTWKSLASAELAQPVAAAEQAALADEWRDLAQLTSEPGRRRLLAHALRWYVKAAPRLSDLRRQSIRKRVTDELPALDERHYLYFFEELEVEGMDNGDGIRGTDVVFDGRPSPYGLWMQPRANGTAHAKFHLDGQFRRLQGVAAIDDRALNLTKTPLSFRIAGDGRVLWTSQPLKGYKASQPFDINVVGIKDLELRVDCLGPNDMGCATWLDPRLEE
jgi:hypothetical protein